MDRRRALTVLASGAACTAGAAAVATGYATASSTPARTAPPGAVGMLYDTTKCIGCKACVVACAEANKLEPDRAWSDGLYQAPVALNSKTKNIIKLYKSGGEESFVKAQCMHCIDPACTSACMMHALQKDEKGIVYWDGALCVGCRYCQVACPYNVPKFEWSSISPKIVKCELCRDRLAKGGIPACVEVCPRKAVIYGTRDELLAEAHRRLKEQPNKYIQKVYGETEGGGTQVLYLAHVDFIKLGLPELGERAVPETVRNVQGTVYKGFVAPVALYGLLALIVRRNRRKQETEEAAARDATGKEL